MAKSVANDRSGHAAAKSLLRVSASKLDLAMECLYWTTVALPPDKSGRSASIMGTPFHDAVATGASAPLDDDHEEWLSQNRFEGWLRTGRKLLAGNTYRQEVAYCLGPDGKVQELGENIGRNYGFAVGIRGTVDVVVPGAESVDFKTGKRLKSAKDSWQLRFASVVADTPKRSFHYVNEAGETDPDSYTASAAEREDDKARLIVLQSNILSGRTEAQPGEHCRSLYCPARTVCEAHIDHTKQQEKPMGRMNLKSITKGKIEAPLSVLVYGTEGIGKSSFAAGAPAPTFLDPDNGTGLLDVARFPKPESWTDCIEALDTLISEPHEFKTFVTDTADALEALAQAEVCRRGGKKGIEDFGFGKGYTATLDLGREYLKKLEALQAKGMHIVTLAHAHVKNFQNPAGDNYDRYQLKMNDKFAALLREWHVAVLFANYKTFTVEKDGKTKALGDGSRVLYTEHRPAWSAKNRYGLPYEIPLDWAEFERAARAGEPAAMEAVVKELDELIASAPEALQKQATESRGRAGKDVRKLSLLCNWLRGKLSQSAEAAA